MHQRSKCPARLASCHNCGKKGRFSKVCLNKEDSSDSRMSSASMEYRPTLSIIFDNSKDGLSKATEVTS